MSFEFVQINNRNLVETIEKINGKQAVGFEVVNSQIIDLLQVNIDPQHTGVKQFENKYEPENKSASLWVLGKLPTIDATYQNTIVFEKIDIDALCAATLWVNAEKLAAMENDPINHDKFLNLCNRVKEIDIIDCGIGSTGIEWDPTVYEKNLLLNEITIFNVLGAMCADFKQPIEEKIELMLNWLLTGSWEGLEKWERQVRTESLQQKNSVIVQYENGITLVESQARGATGLLYSVSPYGVCYNPSFPVKDGTVCKFTVCEFSAGKYLDLQGILDELNTLESGWGGNLNAGIIGSPFAGTSLKPEQVCEIVSRHVK